MTPLGKAVLAQLLVIAAVIAAAVMGWPWFTIPLALVAALVAVVVWVTIESEADRAGRLDKPER